MRTSPLLLAMGVGLATGMVAFTPSVSQASEVRADDTATEACKYYKYWQYSGGTVTCYGAGGEDCAVCAQ